MFEICIAILNYKVYIAFFEYYVLYLIQSNKIEICKIKAFNKYSLYEAVFQLLCYKVLIICHYFAFHFLKCAPITAVLIDSIEMH